MDDLRFDGLARAAAGRHPRRGVLRGLIGGAAALLGAARTAGVDAHAGEVPLGGACIRSHHCVQYYTATGPGYDSGAQAVACDFNGFPADGEFNCCRYRGGFCASDHECCGWLRCLGGYCGS